VRSQGVKVAGVTSAPGASDYEGIPEQMRLEDDGAPVASDES
jgi:hypothetical protein